MAINKLTDPSALPASTDDYVAQNNAINYHTLNSTPPYPVSGSNVLKGSVFNIGGDLFYAAADTAITGTASDYVKLTPGASTATAAFETAANVTSNVTWSDTYNGYYDVSGNLYLFDELEAVRLGALSKSKSLLWGNLKLSSIFIAVDSFAAPSTSPYGVTYDSSTGNLISSDNTTDFIYIHGRVVYRG